MTLGAVASQFAQDPSAGPEKPDFNRRSNMLGLRTINTAEVGELSTYGAYASWQTLLTHQQEYLNDWLARVYYSKDANVHFDRKANRSAGFRMVEAGGVGRLRGTHST